MEKLLVYPFDEAFQPILQYGSLIQDKLILSLVSPAGWGLVGSEYYTNDGTVLSVSVDFESELEKCDALWIVNSQDMPDGDDEIIKKVEYAISHNKDVYFTRNKSESLEYSRFDRSSCSDAVHGFPCECEILFNELRSISTPVLLISDLYGGMNSLWLELSIRRNLIKEGYRVLSISCDKTASLIGCITYPDKLFTGDLDTKEKILMINNYLIQKEALYTPDIIVASIPNGLMNCSPRCLDQFGYYMFLISKSVSPDLCVLRLPFNNYSKMELDHLLEYISNTFGVTTDFLYFANKYLLLEDSEIYGYPRYLNLSKDFVSENKTEKEEQGIFYYTEEESLTKEIIKKLSSYGNDTLSLIHI